MTRGISEMVSHGIPNALVGVRFLHPPQNQIMKIEKKVGFVGRWKIDELTQFWPKKDIEEKGIQVISLLD